MRGTCSGWYRSRSSGSYSASCVSPAPRAKPGADPHAARRLVLYLVYFPAHLKYCRTLPLPATEANDALLARPAEPSPSAPAAAAAAANEPDERPRERERQPLLTKPRVEYGTTAEWKIAITLATVVFLHLALLTVLAIGLLHFLPVNPPHPLVRGYARFLGTSSAVLAVTQYAPQLVRTYRAKLVGALSIGTMIIQVPGSVLFVGSLVGREGVEWSTWASYAVTGGMQAALLAMCIVWKQRQARLGVDDFGKPMELPEEREQVEGG